MKIYIRDSNNIFQEELEISPYDKIPPLSTLIAPPETVGNEVARWLGNGWEILPEYPEIPEPIVTPPTSVTARQARLALLQMNLLDQVQLSLDSIENVSERQAALIEWEYATTIERDSPLVNSMAQSMNLSEQNLDDLFTLAASL